jgi:hypothetical protein
MIKETFFSLLLIKRGVKNNLTNEQKREKIHFLCGEENSPLFSDTRVFGDFL